MIYFVHGYKPMPAAFLLNNKNIIRNYATTSTMLTENNEISSKIFNLIKDFIKDESLSSFLSKTDLILVLEELKSNEQLWIDNKVNFDKYWDKVDEQIRNEKRRIDEIIGSTYAYTYNYNYTYINRIFINQ